MMNSKNPNRSPIRFAFVGVRPSPCGAKKSVLSLIAEAAQDVLPVEPLMCRAANSQGGSRRGTIGRQAILPQIRSLA